MKTQTNLQSSLRPNVLAITKPTLLTALASLALNSCVVPATMRGPDGSFYECYHYPDGTTDIRDHDGQTYSIDLPMPSHLRWAQGGARPPYVERRSPPPPLRTDSAPVAHGQSSETKPSDSKSTEPANPAPQVSGAADQVRQWLQAQSVQSVALDTTTPNADAIGTALSSAGMKVVRVGADKVGPTTEYVSKVQSLVSHEQSTVTARYRNKTQKF
jgi:hypothetical protein